MDHKPRILVVGSFVMDVIATTERVPASAQTVYGKSFHMAPGGKGANQALQCARLGAQVTMMGCVGDDLFGQALLETPRQAGVDVSRVLVHHGVTSGVGHVTLEVTEHTAQNRIIVIPGANRTLTVEDVSWIRQEISSYDMVLLQLEVPIEVNRAVARWAKEAGVPVMLNPAPATDLDEELLSLVTYLIPNEQEASVETALPLRSENGVLVEEDLHATRRSPCGPIRKTPLPGPFGKRAWKTSSSPWAGRAPPWWVKTASTTSPVSACPMWQIPPPPVTPS